MQNLIDLRVADRLPPLPPDTCPVHFLYQFCKPFPIQSSIKHTLYIGGFQLIDNIGLIDYIITERGIAAIVQTFQGGFPVSFSCFGC